MMTQKQTERTVSELDRSLNDLKGAGISLEDPIDNRAYWDQYYKNKVCSEEPSPFARYVSTLVEPGRELVELGCGNGRDAIVFAEQGLYVTALDLSQAAIDDLNARNIPNAAFVCGDFITADCHRPERYDYAYSRFTIHAINENQETMLLQAMHKALKPGGTLFIEVRSIHDPLYGKGKPMERNAFFYDEHYRRFLVLSELADHLKAAGFQIDYAKESTGFAPYGNDDPPVIRMVAKNCGLGTQG